MKVRLTRKYAERINGISLEGYEVGDAFELPESSARMLMAEQWAIEERRRQSRSIVGGRRETDGRSDDHE